MKTLRVLCALCVAMAPSCFVYDEGLLGLSDGLQSGGQGGNGANSSGGVNNGNGGTGNGGTNTGNGGTNNGNGGTNNGNGGTNNGGSGGGNDGGSGGAPDGGTTGGGGTGGTANCEEIGSTGPFTGVGSTVLIDDFETPWRFLKDPPFNGQWYPTGDALGSSMAPNLDAWSYAERPCASNNHALHVEATGYTNWGVSYDAELWIADNEPADGISEYDGIIFWARTSNPPMSLKLALTDADKTVREINVPPLTQNWKQYKFALSSFSGVDLSEARVVSIVGVAKEHIEFWIDDLSFYKDD